MIIYNIYMAEMLIFQEVTEKQAGQNLIMVSKRLHTHWTKIAHNMDKK